MKRIRRVEPAGCRSEVALLLSAGLGLLGVLLAGTALLAAGWPSYPGLILALVAAGLGLFALLALSSRVLASVVRQRSWPWASGIVWNAIGVESRPRRAARDAILDSPDIRWDQPFTTTIWRQRRPGLASGATEICLVCHLHQADRRLAFHTWADDESPVPAGLRSSIHSWPHWRELESDAAGALLEPSEFASALLAIQAGPASVRERQPG